MKGIRGVAELESEISRLKGELEKAREREKDHEDSLKAMLYMLEDLNESKEKIRGSEERLKGEMEKTIHLLMIAESTAHTTDIDKLIDNVINCTQKLIGCNICLLYLWDNKDKIFQPSHAIGLGHEKISLFRTEALDEGIKFVRKAMDEKVPVIIPHLEIGGFLQWIPDINTIVIIPLLGKRRYLGIIIGIHTNMREVTESSIKIMEGISHQVSTALEDSRLYRESIDRAIDISNKVETIRVMHEIDRAILSTINRGEILDIAMAMVSEVIPCERSVIALVDREKKGFIYNAGFGAGYKNMFIPFTDTSAAEVVEGMMPKYENNLSEIEDILPLEKGFLKDGFLSLITVPLISRGEVIGVLTVGAKRPSAFTPENLSTLENLSSQISIALENSRLITDLEELFLGTVKSLSSAIDAKSPWTAGHSERVTKYAIDIGKGMGLSQKELRDIELGGLLHDIGKLGTYETILDKPGRLTDEEFKLIREHPIKGAEILSPIKQIRHVIPIVRHHHEFYNGKGYPDGLKGDEIPFMARIMCVADSADAMGADRPYRKGRPMDDIIAEVKRCSGTQFDPAVAEIFLKVV